VADFNPLGYLTPYEPGETVELLSKFCPAIDTFQPSGTEHLRRTTVLERERKDDRAQPGVSSQDAAPSHLHITLLRAAARFPDRFPDRFRIMSSSVSGVHFPVSTTEFESFKW
jgi:hypothetical protein